MMSYFKKHYNKITYPIDSNKGRGLRNAQLGAIHAISSYFTLERKEAAIIVMPTGAGKTAVLMMSPYILRKKRVLVVTPSKMVRSQIAEDFGELRTLCVANVFKGNMDKPVVYEMEHLYSDEQIEMLEKADVIIASPNCALTLSETEWAKKNIDFVQIDEAHHTPAKTWQQILINLCEATHVLFTATPFRLDKKEISGEIIYDYPLSKAYEDGIFGEIQYVPVDSSENNDLNIAKKAEEILLNDRECGLDHYLMVRTDTKENAVLLEELYKENTSLKLVRIDSSMASSTIKRRLTELREQKIDGIICVDMLGEGFDFPNLKIAAIHVPHKSLASTLQFIGRFARTNTANIGKAKFVAIDNEELEIENYALYSKDAIWQDMIIGMSEGKNQQEQENRNYYKQFASEDKALLENVPVHAIHPNCHVKIYRATNFDITGEFPEMCNVSGRVLRNREENTIVGIGLDFVTPLWMGNGEKINQEYILYIIHYQKETKMIHIYSQKHSEAMYEELVSSFCDTYEQIPRSEIYRVLGGLKDFEIFNSGMMSKQAESGESYRIMAGSDVSDAIDKNSGRMYSAGHAFCKAVDNSESITIGYSSAAKVWSSSYKDLKDYIQWCDNLGRKIADKKIEVKTNTNFDYLPHPIMLREYPNDIFYAEFDARVYSSAPIIKVIGSNLSMRLTDADITVVETKKDKVKINISIDGYTECLECDLNAKYHSVKNVFVVYCGGDTVFLDDYLTDNPIIYRTFSDATITGMDVILGDYEGDVFDATIIEAVDWEAYSTDLSLEFRKSETDTNVSIQDALYEILKSNGKYKYVIYDHGTGEIADFITIQDTETELLVGLYHVKKKSGTQYNSSVGDVYEVSGQAIKSTMWFATKGKLIDKIVSRHAAGHCKVMVGDDFSKMIKELRGSSKLLRGEVFIVQPSLSKSEPMPEKIQEVLAATETYVKRAGKVNSLKILGSV